MILFYRDRIILEGYVLGRCLLRRRQRLGGDDQQAVFFCVLLGLKFCDRGSSISYKRDDDQQAGFFVYFLAWSSAIEGLA